MGIIQVSKGPGLRWTSLDAGRHHINADRQALFQAIIYAMEAERALLYHSMCPVRERPGASLRSVGRGVGAVVVLLFLVLVVEIPHSVGAGRNAVLAANTPAEVLHNDSVLSNIGCLGRTYLYARGIVAVHTGHRYHLDVY